MGCASAKATAGTNVVAAAESPKTFAATVPKSEDTWGLDTEVTRTGLLIVSISNNGSFGRYNKENATKAIRPGDKIVSLNGQKDSSQMIQVIGQSDVLELEIQRKATRQVKAEGDNLVLASTTCPRPEIEGLECIRAGNADSDMCAVCLEEYEDPNVGVLKLPCGHAFHPCCVMQWFEEGQCRNKLECPLCKQSLKSFIKK